jgi:DNA-binding NarL/FixJ family response regulator
VIRILIADDHPIVREGLGKLLATEDGFKVVGQAADGVEALGGVRRLRPDVLLLDVAMPRASGMDVLSELSKSESPCHVIVLTAALERKQIADALRLGARGVILKDAATSLLFEGIRRVVAGEYWIGRESVSDVIRYLVRGETGEAHARKQKFGLTPRERQIVGAVVAGYTNKEIAGRFSLSEDTVKHHLSNIFDKLGVSSRLELALFAVNHQLVDEGNSAR